MIRRALVILMLAGAVAPAATAAPDFYWATW